MSWKQGKNWSDKFIPEIKAILGVNLMCEPDVKEDQERNTDLIVMQMKSHRIACRIRKHSYLSGYGSEFTIRAKSGGSKTEIHKVLDGWGDFIFYGFADKDEKRLSRWFIGDLDVFRGTYKDGMADVIPNFDGRTALAAFQLSDFPREFVVAWGGTSHDKDVF